MIADARSRSQLLHYKTDHKVHKFEDDINASSIANHYEDNEFMLMNEPNTSVTDENESPTITHKPSDANLRCPVLIESRKMS